MVKTLNQVNKWLMHLCRVIAMVSLFIIVLSMVLGVLFRFVIGTPLVGSDEVALIAIVWLTMICAPLGLHMSEHVSLNMLIDKVSGRILMLTKLIGLGVVLFVCFNILHFSSAFLKGGFSQSLPTLQWLSQGWSYLAVPVGFLITAFVALLQILNILTGYEITPDRLFWEETDADELTSGGSGA